MRLIDIEDISLLKTVGEGGLSAKALWRRINNQPTVDAVPVVRCKDCIRWRQSKSDTTAMVCDWDGYEKTEKDFCSWAKRKDNDTR